MLMEDFNHADICSESNMVRYGEIKQPRRLLASAKVNFQVGDRTIRGEVLMDLLLNNADNFIKEVETRGTLSCSDHALVEFVISRNTGLAKIRAQENELQEGELLAVLGITG